MIDTTCPHCSHRTRLAARLEGKRVLCAECQQTFVARDEDEDEGLPQATKQNGPTQSVIVNFVLSTYLWAFVIVIVVLVLGAIAKWCLRAAGVAI